jgi:hypothetical protein
MIINNEQPLIRPAAEEKQFPHLWLKTYVLIQVPQTKE